MIKIVVEHYIHHDGENDSLKLLRQLLKLNTNMAKKIDELLAKQDQIDATIDEVKKDLDYIKGQLGAGSEGGLTAEEATTLEARVDATLAKLGALDAETDSSQPEA